MEGPVIIKFGGGLITEKENLCTPKIDVIRNLAKIVEQLTQLNLRVIIVHGAGSYGHLKAKTWKLHKGRINEDLPTTNSLSSQDEAIQSVRRDMLNLNQLVSIELQKLGISTSSHPPHEWAVGTGKEFVGDLHRFNLNGELVHITYGDVVECSDDREFGILSGDDICYRLAIELEASHMLFAMGGAPGLMSSPPTDSTAKLIPEWSPNQPFEGVHKSEIDVTGGIYLKLSVGGKISAHVPNVWIIDGEHPERIVELVTDGTTLGTRIIPESP